jgi:serine protease Do
VPNGVLLRSVYPGGPAANAGLKTGDVIFSIDGQPVNDMQSLNYRIATHKPGDVVKVHAHLGRQASDITLTLALPPENPPRELQTIGGRNPLTGARVENLSPAVATELQMPLLAKGVAIVSVTAGTPSSGYGFQSGDIVRGVNGVAVNRVSDLQRALAGASHWDLVIDRSGQRLTLSVDG